MKLRNAWVMALALCGASAAYAVEDDATNWYFGLSASSFDFERKGAGADRYNTDAYLAKVGYDLSQYLAVEGRLGVGDQSSADAANLRLKGERIAGAYVRLTLPFEKVKLYALGGYASTRVQAELVGTASQTKKLEGTSYGVGIELYGNRTTALTAEYMRYIDDETYTDATVGLDNKFDIKAVSFGFVHHF